MENLVTTMAGAHITPEFWSGRRVLVTGHTGFKGSWLALWLTQLGAEVHGIALYPNTTPNHFDLIGLGDLLAGNHRIDIRDQAATAAAIKQINPEFTFHLAAQPLVRQAHAEPVETFCTNVMGTVHVLDALRHAPDLKACIAVTTDKVYRNVEWVWPYRETDALGGHEPYGTSKAASEMAIEAWRNSYFGPNGIGIVSVRAGNVVGGGDWSKDRLVPDFVRAAMSGTPLIMRNPDAVRPWQHVLEPLKGYMIAAEMLAADHRSLPPSLNFGPNADDFRTVRDVVDHAVTIWGGDAAWRHEPDGSIPESRLLTLDNALARDCLGWLPTWGFAACMDRTIGWYKAATTTSNVLELSKAEILDFNKEN
ncbi:MAG: CDP-glucose 4,6-dehydratase [Paracoccaceae bacterium]